MTNDEYLKTLEKTTVPDLKTLYVKVFGTPPATAKKKGDLVKDLHEKFSSINPDKSTESATEADGEKKAKTLSRRGLIIENIKLHIWDRNTLAEYLFMINPAWPIAKNKAAISGTLADLRANKGWTCKISEEGRISVNAA